MRHILIIRQQEEGDLLVKRIQEKNDVAYVFPLFEPSFFPPPSFSSGQGLIITSKNALRAFELYSFMPTIPLYCVGDETAAFAKSLGFPTVLSASGNKEDLVDLICTQGTPSQGPLVYYSGEIIKNGFVEALEGAGFTMKRFIVYKLIPKTSLPTPLYGLLSQGTLTHVLFFSPATTALFIHLLKKSGLTSASSTMTSLCLSPDVVKEAKKVTWKKIWTSPYPTLAAMMDYFHGNE